jgi:Rrf2 family iron-sulfur cluster assembly transcriptional regulator
VRLEVTRRAELAVRALAAIGSADGRVKGRHLAEVCETTPSFLTQVMSPLVKAGWVRSDPGPTGGYALDVDLDGLTVLAVIEAVDGATDDGRCVVSGRACDSSVPCVLHGAWTRARAELERVLGSVAVSDLTAAVR